MKLLPFVPDGPEITERHAHRRKLNSGLSCEDVQIPLAFVKPSQYVLFDAYGFRCAAHGHGKRERLVTAHVPLLPWVLGSLIADHLPLHVRDGIGSTTGERDGGERKLGSLGLQLASDVAERAAEVSTDQGERRNGCNRDQRGNQGVFDRRDARLIVDEL